MKRTDDGERESITAVVTGASRGIGLEIARSLRELCDSLILVATREESFSPEIKDEFSRNTEFYGADFTFSDSVKVLAEDIASKHPKIDILVNNAGVYLERPLSESDLGDLEKMIDVNVKAPIVFTRMMIEQLKKGSNSIVINISSIQAVRPTENLAAYAATKAALSTFSRVLRQELNPLGIRVTTLEPCGVNTWGASDPVNILDPKDIGELIKTILRQDPSVQIEEITLSAVTPIPRARV